MVEERTVRRLMSQKYCFVYFSQRMLEGSRREGVVEDGDDDVCVMDVWRRRGFRNWGGVA